MESKGLKLRRKSINNEENKLKRNDSRKCQPDRPCHKASDSLLSSYSGFDDFGRIVVWLIIVLSVAGTSLLLENINKHGVRIDPSKWWFLLTGCREGFLESTFVYLFLYSTIPASICLLLEISIARNVIRENYGIIAHIVNFSQLIIFPLVFVFNSSTLSLIAAMYVCFLYIIQFLKLWSYVQVNFWCRNQTTQSNLSEIGSQIFYPDNLTAKDMAYFFFAPTLCYELNFPRTDHIRKSFLLRCVLEVILLLVLILCISQQWMAPCANAAVLSSSKNEGALKTTEYMLKLGVPAAFVWFAMFYGYFHCFLNILGEVLYFADRSFYYDWWNATSMDVHWRKWNVPVYRWASRHIYKPLIELGASRNVGKLVVFVLSAFFHEYLYCVVLRVSEYRAFIGMSCQGIFGELIIQLIKYLGPTVGTIFQLSSNIFGAPGIILMYYHKYIVTHYGEPMLEVFLTTIED